MLDIEVIHYTNSSMYTISEQDIKNTKFKQTNKSTQDIRNTIGVNLNPYRAVNLKTGVIWEAQIGEDEENIVTTDRLFMKN